jgi:hypothetical protein
LSDNVGKEATKLGTNIDTLISIYNLKSDKKLPNTTGVLVTDAISLIGSSYVKHRQANELKKYVKEGDTLILILTEAIKTELKNIVINNWLQPLKDELKDRQENFLRNLPNSDYKVYFANSFNKEVATLIARIDNLEQLTNKTINSVEHINKAHKQLLENIQKRKKIKEVLTETQQLYVSVNDILSNYQALTKIQ